MNGSRGTRSISVDCAEAHVKLRYGCNPHQGQAAFAATDAVRVLAGAPSMINMLDALNAWQLVRELRAALDLPAAASFKHLSPAGAAVAVELGDDLRRAYEVGERELSPLATAYVRARGADPKSSFGDFVGLSDPVDYATANYLKGVVSDGVIAPGFEQGALATLAAKKGGSFLVIEANADYAPPERETREVFGVALTQERNSRPISVRDLADVVCGELTGEAKCDLMLALITLKYTQSNSVAYALGGQMIGIGAGQQSRVDCTRLAGAKADTWHLGRHPKVLGLAFRRGVRRQERINWRVRFIDDDMTPDESATFAAALGKPAAPLTARERSAWLAELDGVSLASDGFLPFRDNVDHAARHGVRFIAQPGGSARDAEVEQACQDHDIAMAHTGLRLFHH
ncbi:MAG: phosphoribosylaminoimidazolecarboxamide formyltransferase [Gammaproteobacteria bacterium]|nr:phosphoribosylaminoimidazolecarboxamide formyltransferase [Gammaproteobacteria bacterium]